jgi:hypothetical protein
LPQYDAHKRVLPSAETLVVAAFALSLALIAGLSFLTVRNIRVQADNYSWLAHTQEVIAAAEAIASEFQGAESEQRGYLLTGNHALLGRHQRALAEVQSHISALERLTPARRRGSRGCARRPPRRPISTTGPSASMTQATGGRPSGWCAAARGSGRWPGSSRSPTR